MWLHGKNKLYNFLYSLCCTDLIAFTRKFNWLNLLIHCLPGSNSNTGFQTSLYYCRIMADFQLCCVRTHCSFLSSKKIQTTSQKTTAETSLTFKGDGWFCFSPMGMSFAYFIIEGTFFVTEKSCYDAVYQVLMMHDLDLLLLLLIDLLLVLVNYYYYWHRQKAATLYNHEENDKYSH